MGRLATFLTGMAVGAVLVVGSIHYHLVRANDGFHLIRKLEADFRDPYLDIRGYTVTDWQQRPAVALAISKSKKAYLLSDATAETLRQVGLDFWNRANTSSP